jgi:dihydropyrimidine dehydrogenase (NAD+) subunit PreA
MIAGLEQYMDSHGFATIDQFVGKALTNVKPWEELNLKYSVKASIDEDKCIGCQLCYAACEDGAHQAIDLNPDKSNRTPKINEENCVGCNLCSLVCPVENCITMVRKDDGKEHLTWKQRTDAYDVPTTFDDMMAGGLSHSVKNPMEAFKK